jgi:hypothetical protein
MARGWRAQRWFPIWLLVVCATGAIALGQNYATKPDARDLRFYWARHAWQATYDAVSAACGVGRTTYDLARDYTNAGRWTLLGLGLTGAGLFLAATMRPMLALLGVRDASARRTALIWFVASPLLLTLVVWGAGRALCPEVGFGESTYLVLAAFFSLGLVASPADPGTAATLALIGWVAALGWPAWFCLWPAFRRRVPGWRVIAASAIGFTVFLAAAGAVVALLEAPRGPVRNPVMSSRERPALAAAPPAERLARGVVLSTCAALVGVASERISDGDVRDASKAIVALVVTIGGSAGFAGGGIGWPVLCCAIAGAAAMLRGRQASATAAQQPSPVAVASSIVVLMLLLVLVTAGGLLVIETLTAEQYQSPATFADALIDSAAAVCGANVSSGLSEAVTGRNLVSGMRQTGGPSQTNLYPYGMSWLMAAMLLGRILPVLLLARMPVGDRACAESEPGAAVPAPHD